MITVKVIDTLFVVSPWFRGDRRYAVQLWGEDIRQQLGQRESQWRRECNREGIRALYIARHPDYAY